MPSYKLIYFDGEGRAEVARYLFALANVEYEDIRIDQSKWPEYKKSCKQGQVPILEVDGVQFPQSLAIVRYLAREFGYYTDNNLDNLRIDVVVDSALEMFEKSARAFFDDRGNKEELSKKFKNEDLPKWSKIMAELLDSNESDTGYFVGDKLTLADLSAFNIFHDFLPKVGFGGGESSYPKLVALIDRVKEIPEIAAWLQKRPQNPIA